MSAGPAGKPIGRRSAARRRTGARLPVAAAAFASLLLALSAAPLHSHADARPDAPGTCAVCHSGHLAPAPSSVPSVAAPPLPAGEVVPPTPSTARPAADRPPSHRPRAPPA